MSIRGNSSQNIKFTQIDSKFSSSVICLYLGVDVDSEICLFICFVKLLYSSINSYDSAYGSHLQIATAPLHSGLHF